MIGSVSAEIGHVGDDTVATPPGAFDVGDGRIDEDLGVAPPPPSRRRAPPDGLWPHRCRPERRRDQNDASVEIDDDRHVPPCAGFKSRTPQACCNGENAIVISMRARETPAKTRAHAQTRPLSIPKIDAIDLLAAFPERTFTLSEIARAAKINIASCHAVMNALIDRGYLTRRGDQRTYSLGPALMAIGAAALKSQPLIARATTPPRRCPASSTCPYCSAPWPAKRSSGSSRSPTRPAGAPAFGSVEIDRSVGVELKLVALAERVAVQRIGHEEVAGVIHGQRPEALDRRKWSSLPK